MADGSVDVDDLQVVENVLQAKVPANICKKKTVRTVRKPEGPARFDPQSAEWRQIWEEQESEKKEKEAKQKELERKRADREETKREKEKQKKEREVKKQAKQNQTKGKRKASSQSLDEIFNRKRKK